MDLAIAGKTALVTGASSGIGRGIALALGSEGVRLAITARRRTLLEEVGGEIVTIPHGVTRFSITMVCLEARYVEGEFHSSFYQKGVWLPPAELSAYPVSSAQRRLIGELTKPNRQRGLF